MTREASESFEWEPFIGRALAYVCVALADMASKTVLERAEFLMALGLPRKEAALVVGSTDESLGALARQRAKRAAAK